MMSNSRRAISVWASIFIVCCIGIGLLWKWIFPPKHEHCITAAKMLLRGYAEANDGAYPTSSRGWGDALLKLNEHTDDPKNWISVVTGVDDDGELFYEALKTGGDVREEDCSRVYVQGLSTNSPGGIALLFDRVSVPGGDHARCRFRANVREVVYTSGGSSNTVQDKDWPAFVAAQKELLLAAGFAESTIDDLYQLP